MSTTKAQSIQQESHDRNHEPCFRRSDSILQLATTVYILAGIAVPIVRHELFSPVVLLAATLSVTQIGIRFAKVPLFFIEHNQRGTSLKLTDDQGLTDDQQKQLRKEAEQLQLENDARDDFLYHNMAFISQSFLIFAEMIANQAGGNAHGRHGCLSGTVGQWIMGILWGFYACHIYSLSRIFNRGEQYLSTYINRTFWCRHVMGWFQVARLWMPPATPLTLLRMATIIFYTALMIGPDLQKLGWL